MRDNTIELVVATQKIVGSPDDAVFILPLIRPFLKYDFPSPTLPHTRSLSPPPRRYEPAKSQLSSAAEFAQCVLPSISRRGFRNELLRLSELRKNNRMRAQQSPSSSSSPSSASPVQPKPSSASAENAEASLQDILDAVGLDSAIVQPDQPPPPAPHPAPPSPTPSVPAGPVDSDEQVRRRN